LGVVFDVQKLIRKSIKIGIGEQFKGLISSYLPEDGIEKTLRKLTVCKHACFNDFWC